MAENSKIEWTHHTFNSHRGCTKVSDECKHCYAETLTRNRMGLRVWGPTADRQPASEAYWKQLPKWNKAAGEAGERHRVFVASLADIYEGDATCQKGDAWRVVTESRKRLFDTIPAMEHLDFLLLTKRPENIMLYSPAHWSDGFPQNVWVGTSVGNQEAADKRVPHLLQVPAVVRFLSCEPLLGPVTLWSLNEFDGRYEGVGMIEKGVTYETEYGRESEDASYPGIDWVIVGGESGPGARPMHPDWARSLRDQCASADVRFFFKQHGEHLHESQGALTTVGIPRHCPTKIWEDGSLSFRVGKAEAGRLLDGVEYSEFPEVARGN